MKRFWAAVIDYWVMTLIFMVIGAIVIDVVRTWSLLENSKNFFVIFISMAVFLFIYTFLFYLIMDCAFKGSSIGKKIVKIRLLADGEEVDSAVAWKHSALKFAAACIWPISLIYYLVTGRMFYDEWLKLEVVLETEGGK